MTFLFTDIEGSTRLWEHHPEAMHSSLANHDVALRGAIEAGGGRIFKAGGDGFCAVFAAAERALAAAVVAQGELADAGWDGLDPLRVRMALHTGAAEERQGDYFGPTVNRTARLLSAGHGAQILLTLAAREAVADCLPEGVILRDLGTYLLKDLAGPDRVFQAVVPGLRTSFPPLSARGGGSRGVDLPPLLDENREERALELFIRRALDVDPDFSVTNETAPVLAGICAALGGLPLAIELAAARIHQFPPRTMLDEFQACRRRVGGSDGCLLTLRHTIGWTHELLDADQQALFRRFAVFMGGCTPRAVAAVCGSAESAPADASARPVALALTGLLRKHTGTDGDLRFQMDDWVREAGLQQLAASGEGRATRRRHAAFFLALAEAAEPELSGAERDLWLDCLETEHDNLRTAMAWSHVEGEDAAAGLRLARALDSFWRARGHDDEGRWWSDQSAQRSRVAGRAPSR